MTVIAGAALIGAWGHVPDIDRWMPGQSRMVIPTALAVLFAGLGFIAQASGAKRLLGLAGAALLAEVLWHATGPWHGQLLPRLHLGFLDRLVDPMFGDTVPMATNSMIGLLLVGLAQTLLALDRTSRGLVGAAAGMIAALALLPLLQYFAWLVAFGPVGLYQGMSVPACTSLILAALALLVAESGTADRAVPFMSAALGMLFSIGLISTTAMSSLRKANVDVTRSYEIRTEVGRFVEEVARAESSSRAYALTGEKYFAQRVPDHEREALALLDRLIEMTSDNPGQGERLKRLRALAVEKFAQNEAMLRAREIHGAGAAADYLRALLAEPGQPTSNLVVLAQAIRDENNRSLQARSVAEFALERNTRIVQVTGSLLALVLIGTALYQTRRAGLARRTAEDQFRTAFADAGIGMALVATDGRWLRANRTLLAFFGYSEAELLKLNFQAVTHPDDLAADLQHVEDLLAGKAQTYRMNKRYRRADGRVVWGHLTVSLVRNTAGQPLHFISQIEDITARKQLEEELTTARDDALAAARSKSEFLATMSHEIRTPMNGILGSMDLLNESTLDGDQRELVELVRTSADALMRVLNDILDFSKIEQGKLSVTPTVADLGYLIRETCELFAAQAEQKRLHLTVSLPPTLAGDYWIDGDRFRQVLNNLISNALKFTESGQVDVQAELAPSRPGPAAAQWFRFRVRDTGIGIPPEAQGRLFQSFTQVDGSTSRRFGGTGLGLAIAKRLVELLGGQIGMESAVGRGTEVWFDLPLLRPPADSDTTVAPITVPGPQSGQILVAEDNPINQVVIQRMLERMGYAVQVADQGLAVLTALAQRHFDALLLDCQMPQLDGYETARRIRGGEFGLNPGIPIIALSAHVMPVDQAKCFASGMDDALPKPVEREDLGAALQLVGRARGFDRQVAAREAGFRRSTIVLDPAVVSSLRKRPGAQGPSLWPEAAAEYLAFKSRQADAIEAAAAAKAERRLAEAAHALADQSAAIGAMELTACASALETAARTGQWKEVPGLLKVLRQARTHLRAALRQAFPPTEEPA